MQSDAPPPAYYAPPPACAAPCAEHPLLPPAPSRWEERPRYGLLGAGAGVLGGLWMINIITAASIPPVDRGATVWPLYLPLLGPFLEMANVEGWSRGVLALNGLAQLGGLAMIIAGATAKRKIARYGDRLMILPAPAGNRGGMAATVRF